MATHETVERTSKNFVFTIATRLKRFVREVRAELRKVTWPNRRELIAFTGVVFVSVICVAALIWVFDTAFAGVFNAIIR